MKPEPLHSSQAPAPIGPYCQAAAAGHLVFLSGQIALDPLSGALSGSTVEEQTRQIMRNITAVLSSQGLPLDALVKTTVYLTSIESFSAFNRTYEKELGGHAPARSVVEVRALPRGALIEIEGIACR
jgi:2-iminobutanoate/2-iminopropanoate deaminase